MDREVLLALLAFAILGPAVLVAGAWPQRDRHTASARQWERITWRAVWKPVVPAAIALSMLLGWAAMEPENAEPLPAPLIGLSALFALVWTRALIRAGQAARQRRSHLAAGTVGLWRPRIIVATDLVARLDSHQVHAVYAHEAAHVRHRDPLRIWLAQLVTDLQWPWPRARRRFEEWRRVLELARDEEARDEGVDGADLASAVLVGAQWKTVAPRGALLIDGSARLEERIARLLSPLPVDTPTRRTAPTIILMATCLLSVAGGARFGETLMQIAIRSLP
jgi:hypothetical protein